MQRRAEAMVKWWLADVDATDAQQKKIAEIMTTTMRELAPLREQHREARKQVVEILSKPQIDRAALESIRAQELQLAEQVSRRITQSLADAAEVLTPEQRAKLAERMERGTAAPGLRADRRLSAATAGCGARSRCRPHNRGSELASLTRDERPWTSVSRAPRSRAT